LKRRCHKSQQWHQHRQALFLIIVMALNDQQIDDQETRGSQDQYHLQMKY
jgi:hypothetical protein